MCVGLPLRIIAIQGIAAHAEAGEHREVIDLSLTPDAIAGEWFLTHLCAAREVSSAEDAQKITAALEGLRAVMAGDTPGDAFADLENTGPCLPAHLQAAFDAGEEIG